MALCGGFGNAREATEEEQTILHQAKADLESKLGKTFSELKAIAFTTQVVAGVNYVMKIVADGTYYHVKIHKPLPHTNQAPFVLAIDSNAHTADSELAIFE